MWTLLNNQCTVQCVPWQGLHACEPLPSDRQAAVLCLLIGGRYLRATDPFSLPDLRDEALTLANMKQYEGSAQLLREYLAVAPGAPDADMVMEVLQQVLLAAELARAKARRQQG